MLVEPLQKTKKQYKNLKKQEIQYIYQNDLDKVCFKHDMVYEDAKNLTRRTASDKILRDKAFNIAKNPKYDGYQRCLASVFNNFLEKKTSGSGIKNKIISSKELAENLHKPIIKKFKKIKVQSSFIYSIWGTDQADMQLIGKFNKGIHFLLCLFNISSKYA